MNPRQPVEALRRRVESSWTPEEVASALRHEPGCAALVGSWFDRPGGAIVACRPTTTLSAGGHLDPFTLLDEPVPFAAGSEQQTGVFGGWIGYLGYQAGSLVERLPAPPRRPHPMPSWHLGWYDHLLRYDPDDGWCAEALVTPTTREAMDGRLDELASLLAGPPPPPSVPRLGPFTATPSGDGHRKAIGRTLDHILAGDIYQANICLRLDAHLLHGDPVDVFTTGTRALAPRYGAFLDLGGGRAVTSFSPEQFLRRAGRTVTTAPIKGTRRRGPGSEPDDLAGSGKDRAENVMIVDLMRNDLGRVCVPGSIRVPRLFDVEAHPGLWHLVSEVTGELRPDVGDGALLRATVPPGSVTGAPKVRAMEVIAEVEATGREVYTGAIGMVSPVAGAEWNVAIRTFEHVGADVWIGVGGGIVAESDPDAELAECLTKAGPLVEALGAMIAPLEHD